MDKNELATRIRTARLLAGITQQKLGDHLGKSAAAISEIERGRVGIGASDLYSIAKFLGKPLSFFFSNPDRSDLIDEFAILLSDLDPAFIQYALDETRESILRYHLARRIIEEHDPKILDSLIRQYHKPSRWEMGESDPVVNLHEQVGEKIKEHYKNLITKRR